MKLMFLSLTALEVASLVALFTRVTGWPFWLAALVALLITALTQGGAVVLGIWWRMRQAQHAINRIWPGEWPPAA